MPSNRNERQSSYKAPTPLLYWCRPVEEAPRTRGFFIIKTPPTSDGAKSYTPKRRGSIPGTSRFHISTISSVRVCRRHENLLDVIVLKSAIVAAVDLLADAYEGATGIDDLIAVSNVSAPLHSNLFLLAVRDKVEGRGLTCPAYLVANYPIIQYLREQ